jgi:hypothetical protein
VEYIHSAAAPILQSCYRRFITAFAASQLRLRLRQKSVDACSTIVPWAIGSRLLAAIIKLHRFSLTISAGPGCTTEIACPNLD